MSAAVDLVNDQEWTFERLAAMLAEPRDYDLDWRRFEIVDGLLVVSPPAGRPHEAIVPQLGHVFVPVVPDGYRVVAAAPVSVGRSYRVTDFTVITDEGYRSPEPTLTGKQVLLAIEIESPSSVTTDRITKPAQYAAAGVAHYWRIETDPLRLVTYRLFDGVYVENGSWGANETARITDPFPVEFEVGSLLPT